MGKKKDDAKPKKSGCLAKLMVLVILFVIGLGGVAYLTFEPQDLSDIEGYRAEASAEPAPGRNVEAVLKASLRNSMRATITEEEINAYLLRTLRMKQEGPLQGYVSLKGVWVRFQDGWAEVIIEREINVENVQRRHTVAFHLEIEQLIGEGGAVNSGIIPVGQSADLVTRLTNPNAGRLGKVPVVEGYLRLVDSSYRELAKLYPAVTETIEGMLEAGMRMSIEEGRLLIAPAPAG